MTNRHTPAVTSPRRTTGRIYTWHKTNCTLTLCAGEWRDVAEGQQGPSAAAGTGALRLLLGDSNYAAGLAGQSGVSDPILSMGRLSDTGAIIS